MPVQRWTVTDPAGRRHAVAFRHGLLGVTVYVDRQVVGRKYRRDPSGSYLFTVSDRAARLDVATPPTGTEYALTVDGNHVGERGLVLSPRPEDTSPEATARRMEARLRREQRRNGGATWFYFIGGLSALNSLLYAGGTDISFPIGLGITQVIDGVALAASGATQTPLYAIAMDLVVAGAFVLIGRTVRAGSDRIYLLGMSLYALDSLIFLLVQDWISVAFHAFALLGLGSGWRAGRTLRAEAVPDDQRSAFSGPR
jgi:hypothetical protein